MPVLAVIRGGGESSTVHAVDVQGTVEVVDLVLHDACVPTGCLEASGATMRVQRIHHDRAEPGHHGMKAADTETAFEELDLLTTDRLNSGVDQDLQGHRLTLKLD